MTQAITGDENIFDYVIVGAGSAGCVLANRLTEDGSTVLLLEAGKWDRDLMIHMPIAIGKILPERLHDWGYFMEPDEGLQGRAIECARGKVIGGSSSVNVTGYFRGHRGDFDRWSADGASGWSFADVLPYFKKSETWEGGADAYRGGDGPLRTQKTRYRDPILKSILNAAEEAGYPVNSDYNGEEQEGLGYLQSTIHKGRRCSAATAYLRPALKRSALKVETQAFASEVLIRNGRAEGVRYRRGGTEKTAYARREVLLCGGAINSPQLLMLSGIGDPAQLEKHGIALKVASPGVGANFQDHISFVTVYRRLDKSTFTPAMRYDRLALSMIKFLLGRESFVGDVPIGISGFLKSKPNKPLPDLQFSFLVSPFPAHPWLPPFSKPAPDSFACRISLLRPRSRGNVTIQSSDPFADVKITPRFFSEMEDLGTLRQGLLMMREFMQQEAMHQHVGAEILPGKDRQSETDIDAFIRSNAVTVHHPAGTCKMGGAGDLNRVVDPQLKVVGVERLRVIDASIMPDMVGGGINAVVMMIAEKAADMIRSDHR